MLEKLSKGYNCSKSEFKLYRLSSESRIKLLFLILILFPQYEKIFLLSSRVFGLLMFLTKLSPSNFISDFKLASSINDGKTSITLVI